MPNRLISAVDIMGNKHTVSVSELRWRPSAYAIVIKNDCILLVPAFGGYALPGGGLELGETIEEALIREVKEETGITVSSAESLGVTSNVFILPGSSEKGRNVQSILLYFRCEYVSGELSAEAFGESEKEFGGFPEWVALHRMAHIKISGSLDWRPFVKKAMR